MEVFPTPTARSARRPPSQIILRYLVTTWAEQLEEANQMLCELMFSALEKSEFEVESEPLPIAVWTAFGVPPRPSFVLRVPLRRERPERIAPLVRQSLVINATTLHSLHGLVLGPEDTPLMNARVELPSLQLATDTDAKGRFYFASVPSEPRAKHLRVRARGCELSITTEEAGQHDQPLVIHLPLTEE
jgi:hypothetical protein